ncbi:LysR family transcriptional regulator [Streptomyces sp. SA15]|uniref:LysR family transcriptional regulator n=1 Tax=Streptomyces sp. SA15 TaxID=934019 RepID=UPI000BB0CB78|nr:LysR family transcriptional regulator [Streptomyces sp. SA15]PAZ15747.1 LysR family transcriptional regulator [Streptomyces sp. SA15]
MTVELRHLRAFIAVCEARSFTHAATRMMVSQPVVSRTVRQLEKAVGAELIDRRTGEARPTEAGTVLLEHARATVAKFDHALSSARSVSRPLLLGYTWSMLDSRIMGAVETWESEHPLHPIITRRGDDRLAGLGDGSTDVALVREQPTGRPGHPENDYQSLTLLSEDRYVALSRDHPLSGRSVLRLEDLTTEVFVDNTASGTVPSGLWPPGRAPQERLPVETFEDWTFAIAAGRGIGLTPASTAALRPHPSLAFVALADAPAVDLHLAWRADAEHPALGAFTGHMKLAFARPSHPPVSPHASPSCP